MNHDLVEHHRTGPPIGFGALDVRASHDGPIPISDEEARSVTGGIIPILLIYYHYHPPN